MRHPSYISSFFCARVVVSHNLISLHKTTKNLLFHVRYSIREVCAAENSPVIVEVKDSLNENERA